MAQQVLDVLAAVLICGMIRKMEETVFGTIMTQIIEELQHLIAN